MGLKDALFGKAPKTNIFTKDLLSKEQQAALSFLLRETQGDVAGGATPFPGSVETSPIPLENLSLQALEDRVREIGSGGSPLEQSIQQQLLGIISSGGTPVGGQVFEDFFRTNVEEPLTTAFTDRLADVGARFGGNSLFSSDRREADARAKEDFLDALTSSRADLAFRDRDRSLNSLFQALGLGQGFNNGTNDIATAFQAALGSRGFEQQNFQNRFDVFQAQQEERQKQLFQLLSAIGIPTLENIGVTKGGTQGILNSLIEAGGNILASQQ